LIFAPYLILTVTSELWPSRQDWRGARWLVIVLLVLLLVAVCLAWYFQLFPTVFSLATLVASRVNFVLLILLALDLCFLIFAEVIVRGLRH
jgi:hypothetical protein